MGIMLRCAGCGEIIWFAQTRSWGYTGSNWIHSDWFGDGPCRRLDWEKYIKEHPEADNPAASELASEY